MLIDYRFGTNWNSMMKSSLLAGLMFTNNDSFADSYASDYDATNT